jgi:hypothetical protein
MSSHEEQYMQRVDDLLTPNYEQDIPHIIKLWCGITLLTFALTNFLVAKKAQRKKS